MIVTLLICGLMTGILSSFFGVGGGIIIVPTLYFMFPEYPHTLVIGTSLSLIFVNGLLNTYLYYKKKTPINKRLLLLLGPGMLIGAYIGSIATERLDTIVIKIILAVILVVVGIRLIFKKKSKIEDNPSIPKIPPFTLITTGLLGGTVSGATGLGGGAVLTPILIEVGKAPIRLIPAHNNIMKALAALVGIAKSLTYATPSAVAYAEYCIGHINYFFVAIMFIGSNIGVRTGIYMIHKIDQRTAEILFSILLIGVSSKILYSTI
jgi:uncharacterized membrane protein YfcA